MEYERSGQLSRAGDQYPDQWFFPVVRGWRGMSPEVGGGAWEPEGLGRVLPSRLSAWLPAQFLACTHLEAVVSSCRAGLRLRSGLDARALETSPGPTDTPSEQERKAKEKEKNRKKTFLFK